MRKTVTVYTNPADDLDQKYGSEADSLKVKWKVVVKSTQGFVKANAKLVDMGAAVSDDPLTTWQVRELLRVPDKVTEQAAEKFLKMGEKEKQRHIRLAEAI